MSVAHIDRVGRKFRNYAECSHNCRRAASSCSGCLFRADASHGRFTVFANGAKRDFPFRREW